MSSSKKSFPKDLLGSIRKDAARAEKAPDKVGILRMAPVNSFIAEAMTMPDPKVYFRGLIVEGENTVVFASSNTGKSILCMQMAEDIAHEHKVVYVDCELSIKQVQMRYTNAESKSAHLFPANFIRAEIDPELIVDNNLEQAILSSIEQAASEGIRFFFVDNITFLCNDSEKGQTAGEFMMHLIKLKRKYDLTIIVVAHSPKRDRRQPFTQNDLAGSAKLMNFFDAGIAVGVSAKDPTIRYVKQVKVRTGTYSYGADNVMLFRLEKVDNYTMFNFMGYGHENDHLRERNAITEMEDMQEIVNLKSQGKSIREIAEETGIKATTVHRKLRKAEHMGVKPNAEGAAPADGEAFRSTDCSEQVEQVERQQKLPYKD